MKRIFTSESVTEGHPDKICDQISDAILDAVLREDPNSRVACETTVTTQLCGIMGEITTKADVDYEQVARNVIKRIGYTKSEYGFDNVGCKINLALDTQSPDIALGTNDSVGGAGDQGIMFGYACDETKELMPLPISLAHKLAKKLAEVRKEGKLSYLRPDGKTQVSVEYDDLGNPVRVDAIVVSTQHDEDVSLETIKKDIFDYVIRPVVPENYLDDDTKYYINPTGRFVVGGPMGDSGLTGRKIIVDTYGGYARHGGGAFSGKDSTKVDRSAAYMARYAAKNIVANGLAKRCEIELAYAIGVPHPVSILVDTRGSGVMSDNELSDLVAREFDFRPQAIIEKLGLRRAIFEKTAAYGHFGREDEGFSWEIVDKKF